MNEDKPIRLIRACTENTGVLVDALAWFRHERSLILNRLGDEKEPEQIYRLQGEARCLRRLELSLSGMTKAKGELLDEQPRVRAVR